MSQTNVGEGRFGSHIFGKDISGTRMPFELHALLYKKGVLSTIIAKANQSPVDNEFIASIASYCHALYEWCRQHGVDTYTHWCSHASGVVLERHQPFITKGHPDGLFDSFSPSQLLTDVWDTSTFTWGGQRSATYGASYVVWDTSSTAPFIRTVVGRNGESPKKVLCIPSCLITFNGDGLDNKMGIVRTVKAIETSFIDLLYSLGDEQSKLRSISCTCSFAHDFFLIAKEVAEKRPDIQQCGRLLFNSAIENGFNFKAGNDVTNRISSFLMHVDHEFRLLGLPASVYNLNDQNCACHFRLETVMENASCSADHYTLALQIISEAAPVYGLHSLFHPKPFSNLTGNGVDVRWSINEIVKDKSTESHSVNLLDFDSKDDSEETALQYLSLIAAIIRAMDLHGYLLQCSTLNVESSLRTERVKYPLLNLGDAIQKLCTQCMEGRDVKINVVGGKIDVGVLAVPIVQRCCNDLNKTTFMTYHNGSIIFHTPGGSNNSTALLSCWMWNTVMAESLSYISNEVQSMCRGDRNPISVKKAALGTLRTILKQHWRTVYNGDGLHPNVKQEVLRRGIAFEKPLTSDNIIELSSARSIAIFTRNGLFTEQVPRSIVEGVLDKNYDIITRECLCMVSTFKTSIHPAVLKYQTNVASAIVAIRAAMNTQVAPQSTLDLLTKLTMFLHDATEMCTTLEGALTDMESKREKSSNVGEAAETELRPLCEKFAAHIVELENITDNSLWPFPKLADIVK